MMTYEEASKLPSSEKITLVTCEAVQQVKIFENYSGFTWKKSVDNFVLSVKWNGLFMDQGADKNTLSAGEFFYSPEEKSVYINVPEDPKNLDILLVYRFFFSNTPLILPWDLSTGTDVEWLPLINSIGSVGQQLDDENTGIVLDSQSQVEFINSSGYFDDKFDSLIWENQNVNFYSFFGGLPVSEIKKIFQGVVENKEFSSDRVSFKIKDFIFKLRDQVNLSDYSIDDGDVPDSFIGKPKRRIYGKANKVKCVPVDATLSGYSLAGSIQFSSGALDIIGTGTEFLKELSPNDEIIVVINDVEYKLTINSVASDTSATVARALEISSTGTTAKVKPARPYRFKNRNWHICGHRIRSSIATIQTVINARVFVVDDVSEFFEGDFITLNSIVTQVSRISGQKIFLEQNISPVPVAGDVIMREPIFNVYSGPNRLVFGRDAFGIIGQDDSLIELTELAEFNISKERLSSVQLTFTNGSREITTTATIDLRTIIQSRDWIRRSTGTASKWFEVLDVSEQKIVIREAYDQVTGTGFGLIKNVELIDEESLILVDCYGKDSGDGSLPGTWIKTATDVVFDLITEDAGFSSINQASFDQARADNDYLISMVIPESIGGDQPLIRDVITKINESVFGSLYVNNEQEICFSLLNTRKPENIEKIGDDDIVSWSVNTSQSIVSSVKVDYSPFVDNITGQDAFETVSFNSEFVSKNIGINKRVERVCYLYNKKDAEIIAQRLAFYNGLSKSILLLNGKANFFDISVNDKIYIGLDRLYKRFAGDSKEKIGIVSGVKRNFSGAEITVNDLGNIFNRCLSVSSDNVENFTLASDSEKIKYGFIVDNNTNTPDPDSEQGLGGNLLG
jgi:hypothetical protein